MSSNRKRLMWGVGLVVLAFIALQIIANVNPSWARTNPEVTYTIDWDSVRTRELVQRACFDCHSNETVWPWYAQIAPASILVARDVHKGRGDMNFSTNHELDVEEMIEQIESGAMPLPLYLPLHPEAVLTDAEKTELIAGLRATFGSTPNDATRDDDNDEAIVPETTETPDSD